MELASSNPDAKMGTDFTQFREFSCVHDFLASSNWILHPPQFQQATAFNLMGGCLFLQHLEIEMLPIVSNKLDILQ